MLQENYANSAGTPAHAKEFLGARNVTADPSNKFYDCGVPFDKLFTAYMYRGKCVPHYRYNAKKPV